MKKFFFPFFFLITIASQAFAITDLNRRITNFGVQGNTSYIIVSPAPSGGCLYEVLYIKGLDTAAGKSLLVTLLAAFTTEKSISRVDYIKESNGTCTVNLIQM
jgi:hypothetical protein